ncbi:methyltransferase domain-containing protein [Cryobacterium sp. CG_9.6]|uniref:methyltransferase domain-containing protein n=1 Tax=Cryobacterium sp. CG_9.6 TaxID=2760710 RepID=UPI002474506B|nr:methyltransferase domain-containing protein [Cryobacterium sp. CG_9.6]MDH6237008.1 23S rRNA (guanine745-N1)-methyltransferase [Cryobacterium sp. CG_9.6]
MSLQTISEWLRCPNCFLPLVPKDPLSLTCGAGHSFDVNKRGYTTMLSGPRKFIGDSTTMLDARDRFQAAGWYEPLQKAIIQTISLERALAAKRILDVGCGTGYYLRAILQELPITAQALGMDLSPVAVARTVRASNAVDGLVADVWSPLPIRDASADIVLNVFAPRNAPEFHRVLRANGLLLVVVPHPTHLQELRAAGLALNIQPDKAGTLADGLANRFTLEAQQSLAFDLTLSPADVADLIGMGPSSHHTDGTAITESDGARGVTAAFDILSFRRRKSV